MIDSNRRLGAALATTIVLIMLAALAAMLASCAVDREYFGPEPGVTPPLAAAQPLPAE